MRLGLNVGYATDDLGSLVRLVERAEQLGVASAWAAEAYGTDAVSVLAYLAAHTSRMRLGSAVLQIPARTPAMTAMTAITLDHLSEGRFALGLGVSGPQVVEGWHGVPYGRPLGRSREYVAIVRTILARQEKLDFHGEHYRIPYDGDDGLGLGKPLRSMAHPLRSDLPILLAAIGPRNVHLAGEIADGWLPHLYSPTHERVLTDQLDLGIAAAGRTADEVEIVASVAVGLDDDLDAARDQVRPWLALYIGGMGARDRNFYTDLVRRYGWEQVADTVQDHYLDGRRDDAAAAIPDALVDELALVGPAERIADRLDAWRESRVTELVLRVDDVDVLTRIVQAAAG